MISAIDENALDYKNDAPAGHHAAAEPGENSEEVDEAARKAQIFAPF